MKITITLDYSELQKIINESATMRAISCSGSCPIIECKNKFLSINSYNNLDYKISTKIDAIKFVRERSRLDGDLRKKLVSLGCSFNPNGNISLADSKNIVEKYFY